MRRTKKVIFIDRDGVINRDPGGWTKHSYVTRWGDFYFLPGAKKALRMLVRAGYDTVIISNQAGVGKGFYAEDKLNFINRKMLEAIRGAGGRIKKVYYCIHQKDDNCDCRKPKTGLFRRSEEDLGIKARGAYFIGDGIMDIEAGKRGELKTVLVLSGKTRQGDIDKLAVKPDFIFKDLYAAVEFILEEER